MLLESNYNYSEDSTICAVFFSNIETFTYDSNGNMLTMADSSNSFNRTITWNEENRITKTNDNNGLTEYVYDDTGNRISKKGKFGELCYINNTFTVRNSTLKSFHIFAGQTRVASRIVTGDGAGTNDGTYYSHGDHLGSSSLVTNKTGGFHEHLEYFPYGEMWVHEKVSEDSYSTPYKFTSKELDPETGLYYHDARYRDPQTGVWVSVDPILNSYLDGKRGMGGVFNPVNLNLYHYAGNNPVKYVDPTGKYMIFQYSRGNCRLTGDCAIRYETDKVENAITGAFHWTVPFSQAIERKLSKTLYGKSLKYNSRWNTSELVVDSIFSALTLGKGKIVTEIVKKFGKGIAKIAGNLISTSSKFFNQVPTAISDIKDYSDDKKLDKYSKMAGIDLGGKNVNETKANVSWLQIKIYEYKHNLKYKWTNDKDFSKQIRKEFNKIKKGKK